MTEQNSPPDGGWEGIRARYEAGVEKVDVIAKEVGLTGLGLSLKAKADGWTLRAKKVKAKLKRLKVLKPEKTSDTIKRLKDLLQDRIKKLEAEIGALGEEVGALNNERQARTVSTVVRTLDKVLELERKDKQQRRKAAKDFKHFDDAERLALAQKIERLEAERDSTMADTGSGPEGSAGAQSSVSVLVETETATAGTP
jgi:uncharacterized protein (UPF0335 family)